MAIKPLKSIKFPGLPDTYTIPQAQIQTNAEDISQLKSDLNQKANQDGYYADLVSGGSTQLLSDMVETDTTPYNYRTAGGSLEIGDREKPKKIVGGSLAVNQLAKALVDGNYNKGLGTAVYDNGTVSFTALERYAAFYGTTIKELVEYHKYLISAKIKMTSQPSTNTVRLGVGNSGYNQGVIYVPSTASVTSFTEISGVVQYSYGTSPTNNYLYLQDNRAEVSQIDMKDLMLFDLTAMFGTTIADYVYTLETATAGAGVAWLKARFPRIFDAGYVPYNAGSFEHVSGLSAHKMVGFNQFDGTVVTGSYIDSNNGEEKANQLYSSSGYIPVLPSTVYYVKSSQTNAMWGAWYDADKNFISGVTNYANATITSPEGAYYLRLTLTSNAGGDPSTFCINLHWNGERDGDYEPYEEHSYPLDSDVTLRGIYKLDANNQLYADGDEYASDGTVTRRYGIVDLGTLTWQLKANATNTFYSWNLRDLIKPNESVLTIANIVCNKYITGTHQYVYNDQTLDKAISVGSSGELGLNDTAYTTIEAISAALSGVYLVYELATPTTESADHYTEIQNVSNWGTEEFVSECLVPVGHETGYQPDLRAKIEVAPESPDTDGVYIMQRKNGLNSYAALASSATIQDIISRLEALEGSGT